MFCFAPGRRPISAFLLIGVCCCEIAFGADPSEDQPRPISRVLTLDIIDEVADAAEKPDAKKMAQVLNIRLRDAARARAVGNDQIAVDIFGEVNEEELTKIREVIGIARILEFRVTADPKFESDKKIVELALKLPPNEKEVKLNGRTVAEWVRYSETEFGNSDHQDVRVIKRLAGDVPEALILIDLWNVSGKYIRSAYKADDSQGRPAVNLSFDHQGARRLGKLTSLNLPNRATGARRFLGIVLRNRLMSAPSIETTVSKNVQISGRTMTSDEVDDFITVLREGRISSPLREVSNLPIAK